MNRPSPEIQNLASQLFACDARSGSSDPGAGTAMHVLEELRGVLIRLTGVHGFRSLLTRALTMAKAEVPSLSTIQVSEDASLEGFEGTEEVCDPGPANEAGILLVAQLLELLVTFIGAPLTLRLLRDKWPKASFAEAAGETEEKT
jgi:hypothetical protein